MLPPLRRQLHNVRIRNNGRYGRYVTYPTEIIKEIQMIGPLKEQSLLVLRKICQIKQEQLCYIWDDIELVISTHLI